LTFVDDWQAVGTKLVVKCGEQGALKLQRAVPIVGGIVAGGFDASACQVPNQRVSSFQSKIYIKIIDASGYFGCQGWFGI
jgi:hypothetical protein